MYNLKIDVHFGECVLGKLKNRRSIPAILDEQLHFFHADCDRSMPSASSVIRLISTVETISSFTMSGNM